MNFSQPAIEYQTLEILFLLVIVNFIVDQFEF
jgi:hypothetical protein